MVATARIAAEHGSFYRIRQAAPVYESTHQTASRSVSNI